MKLVVVAREVLTGTAMRDYWEPIPDDLATDLHQRIAMGILFENGWSSDDIQWTFRVFADTDDDEGHARFLDYAMSAEDLE